MQGRLLVAGLASITVVVAVADKCRSRKFWTGDCR